MTITPERLQQIQAVSLGATPEEADDDCHICDGCGEIETQHRSTGERMTIGCPACIERQCSRSEAAGLTDLLAEVARLTDALEKAENERRLDVAEVRGEWDVQRLRAEAAESRLREMEAALREISRHYRGECHAAFQALLACSQKTDDVAPEFYNESGQRFSRALDRFATLSSPAVKEE